MKAIPAQIEATTPDAAIPCGPWAEPGEIRPRAETLKQGLAGVAVVRPAEEAAEVERLAASFRAELKPVGDLGDVLVRRMAVHAVRMDRAVVQETAAISGRFRTAVEGCRTYYMSDEEAGRRRAEAGNRALFDDSKEAILARKYEAASERAFHKSLKELLRMRAEAVAKEVPAVAKVPAEASAPSGKLGSFFPAPPASEAVAPKLKSAPTVHRTYALTSALLGWEDGPAAHCDIPIAMGRAR